MIVYRNPVWVAGPELLFARDFTDVVDWGLSLQGIPDTWKQSTGAGILVGVCDTGCPRHPDLNDRIAFAANFSTSYSPEDFQGHSTHVCGIIAAARNNQGIVGVAPDAKLCIAKVLGDDGSGSNIGVAKGIEYCLEKDCDIISMSLGGAYDPNVEAAVNRAIAAGKIVVCAAGNDGSTPGQDTTNWPARLGPPVAVASYNKNGQISTFSSRGPEVDVACPGEEVLSTWLNNTYKRLSGTCIAAGELVYTDQGPRAIETIKAGDVVYAFEDGQKVQRVVAGMHDRGTAEVFRLRSAGRDVMATASHEMMVLNTKDKDLEWVRLGQLKEHHRLLLPKQFESQINPYLDRVLTEDACWILGFFAGDGWLSETTRSRRVCFAEKDYPNVMEQLYARYEAVVGKPLKKSTSGDWTYDDSTMVALAIECCGLHKPSAEKTIPLWVWNLSKEKQYAFYSGYVMADGHCYEQAGHSHDAFECTSPTLVRRLACLADYWGLRHTTISSRTRKVQAPNSPQPTWATTYSLRINSGFYSGWARVKAEMGSLAGKKLSQMLKSGIDNFYTSTWRVDEVPEARRHVYDLTVPGADCFVTQGLITHNSMATPFCSGLAALRLSYQRDQERKGIIVPDAVRNTAEFTELIKRTAVDKGDAGRDNNWGWGVIDVQKWMSLNNQSPPAPQPPQTPPATPAQPIDAANDIPIFGGMMRVNLNAELGGKKGIFIYAG